MTAEAPTNEIADVHLPIKAGASVLLFNALLVKLAQKNVLDKQYINSYTTDFEQTLLQANKDIGDKTTLAARIGRVSRLWNELFDLFCQTPQNYEPVWMGVNQSSAGTDKVNAIINCHRQRGVSVKEGASPFL